jgi:hypothetical protein
LQYSFLAKLLRFLKENPSSWFILTFQVLLLGCAVMLVFGLASIAEGVAVVAYFALVVGVIVQLIWFLRRGSDSE